MKQGGFRSIFTGWPLPERCPPAASSFSSRHPVLQVQGPQWELASHALGSAELIRPVRTTCFSGLPALAPGQWLLEHSARGKPSKLGLSWRE